MTNRGSRIKITLRKINKTINQRCNQSKSRYIIGVIYKYKYDINKCKQHEIPVHGVYKDTW